MDKSTLKRYIHSSLQTFLSAFLLVVLTGMEAGVTFEDISWSALILSALYTGLRATIKVVYEVIQDNLKKRVESL